MFSFESCSLTVLYGGIGIIKLKFWLKKMKEKNFQLDGTDNDKL
jgi:hypothetical protein